MQDYSFGECPVCRQGMLIAVKNSATGQLLIMCDDCESQWRSPDEAQSFENVLTEEVHGVEKATFEEVKSNGWVV